MNIFIFPIIWIFVFILTLVQYKVLKKEVNSIFEGKVVKERPLEEDKHDLVGSDLEIIPDEIYKEFETIIVMVTSPTCSSCSEHFRKFFYSLKNTKAKVGFIQLENNDLEIKGVTSKKEEIEGVKFTKIPVSYSYLEQIKIPLYPTYIVIGANRKVNSLTTSTVVIQKFLNSLTDKVLKGGEKDV